MKRVALVAQSPRSLWALHRQFRQLEGLRLTGMVDARRCVSMAVSDMKPDLVVVDGPRGPEIPDLVAAVATAAPGATVVVLTVCDDEDWTEELLGAGAGALLSRSLELATIGTLLREIAAGTIVQAPRSRKPATAGAADSLTRRELEILRFVAAGYRNQQVADLLTVTPQTVKFHLSNVYRKLGVTSRTEATRFAHLHDLVADAPLLSAVSAA